MSKYKALYVEESREHLAELSRLLVILEQIPEPAAIIGEVFRHAHSIKGMSASMGYTATSQLAHRIEDVVGARRTAGGRVPKRTVDLLLAAVDALGAQLEAAADDQVIPEQPELVTALAQEAARGAEAPRPPDQAAVEPPPVPPVVPMPGEPRLVKVRIAATASAPAARAFLVHRRIAGLATILEAQPSLVDLRAGELPGRELRLTVSGADVAALEKAASSVSDVESVVVTAVESTDRKSQKGPDAGDGSKVTSTVRVRTEVLDSLINSVGELFIARERLQSLLTDEERPEVRAALDGLSARIREIHDQVMTVRMMPLRTLTDRYPRLVRDLGGTLGKEVELEAKGSDLELDRAILDNLDAVFVHVLRNAVDHGLETPAERERAGKAQAGRIVITAARDRDMVVVSVTDDGRGLDPEGLRRVAVERGTVTAREAETMTARESLFLICRPGFSTKAEVSDVSGRGVGMDAVRSRIESLGGTVDIESELGRFARFTLRLPLSLAIVPVLLVTAGGTRFAIPAAKVVSVREKGEDVIRQAGGGLYLSFQHALVPVVDLTDLLQLATVAADYVVVIEDGRDLAGVGVTRVIGYHEAVVKPLGDPLDRLDCFSGAAILGDGNPILILDLPRALRQRTGAVAV
jgi:two-component system chemotaxis sensor kinase CheA